MSKRRDVQSFAEECDLDISKWEALDATEQAAVYEIYDDYTSRQDELARLASSLSSFIQRVSGVHSVRWRVKDPAHLVQKIIRNKAKGIEKYLEISVSNYREKITDLVGLRALHLFKNDFPSIHRAIMNTWNIDEGPVAYVRKGDSDELRKMYRDLNLKVEDHSDGYRSIHYIVATNFTKETVFYELQVRTIFEEGWSEIDHKIRYPDFSDDALIQEFLHIFNRLSGAADEMGTFVNKLAEGLKISSAARIEAQSLAEKFASQLEDKIEKIVSISSKNSEMKKEIAELKSLMAEQKSETEKGLLDSRDFGSHFGAGILNKAINEIDYSGDKLYYAHLLSNILGKRVADKGDSSDD